MVSRRDYKAHTQMCLEINSGEQELAGCNSRLARCLTQLQHFQQQPGHAQPELITQLIQACSCVIQIETAAVADDSEELSEHCSTLSQLLDNAGAKIEPGDKQVQLENLYISIKSLLQEKRRAICKLHELHAQMDLAVHDMAPVNMPSPTSVGKISGERARRWSEKSPDRKATTIKDFDIVKPISHGAYGAVVLAKKRSTGDYFALKKLKKSHMVRKKQVEHVMRERNILAMTNNPFLVKMFYAFQSQNNLFVVMEFCQGGDLACMLENLGAFTESMVRAYTAELVLGLVYLKEQKIVHRDLKPDNILIGADGHIKVTDFGLSYGALVEHVAGEMDQISERHTQMEEAIEQEAETGESGRRQTVSMKRYSEVGTPHYLAPEILTGVGHSYPVDYWALGVMVYEFCYGVPPFDGQDLATIFQKITSCDIEWYDDVEISQPCKQLVEALLDIDADCRLGSDSLQDLQDHPFFEGIEWDSLLHSEAVFVPEPEDPTSTEYFVDKEDEEGVLDGWSFDGLDASREGLEEMDDDGCLEDDYDDEGDLGNSTNFLGFSYQNLSLLKDMNLKAMPLSRDSSRHELGEPTLDKTALGKIKQTEPTPTTPGGTTLRSSMM